MAKPDPHPYSDDAGYCHVCFLPKENAVHATDDRITRAYTRFMRNMTIAQMALGKPTVAAMIHIQVTAVLSACEELLGLLEAVPDATVLSHDQQIIGPATAALLAETQGSAPDHIPNDWT